MKYLQQNAMLQILNLDKLCAIFVLITSPTGAHALARGSYVSGVKLWEKSVTDKFKDRAEEIKKQVGEAR